MVNPVAYASSNTLQQCNVSAIMDEFADELETMDGKCMDIGCGPGDITKNIVLPALGAKAVMIGKGSYQIIIVHTNHGLYRNCRSIPRLFVT